MDDIEVDVETVRVQLMKAEWPHGGHGTLDQTTAALSRILTRLRTAEDKVIELTGREASP
jgi:hypothetical protein